MKFRVKVRYKGACDKNAWWEDYEDDQITTVDQAFEWADKTLAKFNAWAVEEGRGERVVLAVEVTDASAQREHLWRRTEWTQTRTLAGGRKQTYDALECERCGITAKRLIPLMTVKLDSKWRGKCYQRCDTSQEHRRKKGEIE